MIELDALTFRYAGAEEPALHSLSLRVPRGGFLGILGPSRSGKTTLLSVLSGAVPTTGPATSTAPAASAAWTRSSTRPRT